MDPLVLVEAGESPHHLKSEEIDEKSLSGDGQ